MAHKSIPEDQIILKEALCLQSASSDFAEGANTHTTWSFETVLLLVNWQLQPRVEYIFVIV